MTAKTIDDPVAPWTMAKPSTGEVSTIWASSHGEGKQEQLKLEPRSCGPRFRVYGMRIAADGTRRYAR
jgi:hypothetical protein